MVPRAGFEPATTRSPYFVPGSAVTSGSAAWLAFYSRALYQAELPRVSSLRFVFWFILSFYWDFAGFLEDFLFFLFG